MTFAPKYTFESAACPGVVVTLGRMGPKRRAATELQVSEARSRYRLLIQASEKADSALQAALNAIPGYRDAVLALEHKDGKLNVALTPEIIGMVSDEAWELSGVRSEKQEQAAAIARAEIHPAFVVAAVQSITGIESDVPYTAEMICEFGPDELFDELVKVITESAYAGTEKSSNLQ